ncbi:MAG: DUF2093 domain-containing protein [Alphaproteobacteria bacterium]|nr:DUF2093 domain-containing protein [Alphaproteobacteria bacterium]
MEREAVLQFLDADFSIVRPGDFVRCAVTDAKIPLEALRYWNVDRQEAYADAAAAMVAFGYAPRAGKSGAGQETD